MTRQELASESARRSISSLCDEVLSRALKDGVIGDHKVEYEIMETADEVSRFLVKLDLRNHVDSAWDSPSDCSRINFSLSWLFFEVLP